MRKKGGGVIAAGIGLIILVACTVLLFQNEKRSVNREKALEEIKNAIEINSNNTEVDDGEMIVIADRVIGMETLYDETFGVVAPEGTIKLMREVSMFQWEESSTTKDGKDTYSYEKVWSKDVIDSNDFESPFSHKNPNVMSYSSYKMVSDKVIIGSYDINQVFSDNMNVSEKLLGLKKVTVPNAKIYDNVVFISVEGGSNLKNPAIGDFQVTYTYVPSNVYTLLGEKRGRQLISYTTKNGDLAEVSLGSLTKDELQDEKISDNKSKTFMFRLMLAVGIIIANSMIVSPLTGLIGKVPIVGSLVKGGIGLIGFVAGCCWSLLVIALGWLFFRPLISIGIIALIIAIIYVALRQASKRQLRDETI